MAVVDRLATPSRIRPRLLLAVAVSVLGPLPAHTATCTWNNPGTGAWSAIANWNGCADAPGPSTRAPGPTDTAILVGGTATLAASTTVAELELGPAGVLSVPSGIPTLTISNAVRFAGGSTTTQLGVSQLWIVLPAGASGTLLAPTTLDNATFLFNSGNLALGSASGVALTLQTAARIENRAGATLTLAGGDSRLYLTNSSQVLNLAGATFEVQGNAVIGKPAVAAGTPIVANLGTFRVLGPGTLSFAGGSGATRFDQGGRLEVSGATVSCSLIGGQCQMADQAEGSTTAEFALDTATLDFGGPAGLVPLTTGTLLTGTGTINGRCNAFGRIAPGAVSGLPYGTLTFTGEIEVGAGGELDLDIGGNTAGNHDRLVGQGVFRVGDVASFDGRGTLRLRLAPGYVPALGKSVAIATYASFAPDPGFRLVESNAMLDYAWRFEPTQLVVFPAPRLTIEDASVIEGNAGSTQMTFNVRLSQASASTVTAELRSSSGSAISGSPPSGDYNAGVTPLTFTPGQTLRTAVATIHGDTVVEADEAFVFSAYRNRVQNAAFGNGRSGRLGAAGSILTDDLPPGTRYVLVGKDSGPLGIRRYSSSGQFLDTFDTGQTGAFQPNSGMCFAPDGDFLATRFAGDSLGPILFSRHGARLIDGFGAAPDFFFNRHESCVFDAAGNVYVGQAGFDDTAPDAAVPVLKFNPSGVLLDRFVLPTGDRGTDWLELSANQCTLLYTSEDTTVRRYDVCTRTPLPPLVGNLTPPFCYALRLRPNSELMVACQEAVHRVGAQGAILQTYTRQSIGETNAAGLFALNLDPDGTSFWTAGLLSGNLYRVDIASGTVLASFNTGPGGVGGLAVYDELQEVDTMFADGFESTAIAPVARSHPKRMRPARPPLPHFAHPLLQSPQGER